MPQNYKSKNRSVVRKIDLYSNPLLLPVMIFLTICLFLGGGKATPNLQYYAIFITGSALVALFMRHLKIEIFRDLGVGASLVLLLVLFLPIAQLIPLPPSLWQQFDGREVENSLRAIVGLGNSNHPVSLVPVVTTQFLLSLLLLLIFFLAVRTFNMAERQTIFVVIALFAVVTVVVGMVQAATGGSVLDFYSNSHRGFLLGFFANRNHAALFLAITVVCFLNIVFSSSRKGIGQTVFGVLGVILLLSAIAATGSRMGLALGLVATSASALLFWDPSGLKNRRAIFAFLGLGVAATIALASSAIVSRTVDRFDTVSGDLRWEIWQNSIELGREYAPLGVGIGGFDGAYAKHEDIVDLRPEFINNAHNDYIETFIEAGWPGLVVLALVIMLVVFASYNAFSSPKGVYRNQRMASALILFLIFVHSSVDYPMRRMFIAAIAFFALACLLPNRSYQTK